jgi:stringent starvation protein B
MTLPTDTELQGTSTRPYLIRALHDWCTDNGFTPYLAVYVDASVQVPMEYVKNNEIVLNVSFDATSQLQLGNEFIEFKARFGGVARDIAVPIDHVIAVYARENGQGMAFPVPTAIDDEGMSSNDESSVESAGKPSAIRLAPMPASPDNSSNAPTTADLLTAADHADMHEPEPKPPNSSSSKGGKPSLRRVK